MVTARAWVVVAVFAVVSGIPSVRERRNYAEGYLFDSVEDASIAGDHVVAVGDCSDDDSSESIEPAYIIINKREAPQDPLMRSGIQKIRVPTNVALSKPNLETRV